MRQGHTPYGYRIENGKAVVFEKEAEKVKALFNNYLEGMAIVTAANEAGIEGMTHSMIGRVLRNSHYLGDDYYPAIIDQELFDIAEEERQKRAGDLGRIREYRPKEPEKVIHRYKLGLIQKSFDDPFEQASYVYSLIEREE